MQCDWPTDCIEKNYQRLVADPRVDIILGLGPLNSAMLTRLPVYPKPFIAVGIIDPKMQKLPVTSQQTSGVANLTFITFPRSLDADMESFYTLCPYKRITLIEDRRLMELFSVDNPLTAILAQKGIDLLPIAVDSVDVVLDQLVDTVDAVIIGSLYRFEKRDRAALIEKINRQNLPTFAIVGAGDLKLGALTATRPETDTPRLIRRVALNIERILDGEDPATLPLRLERQHDLYVNMATDTVGSVFLPHGMSSWKRSSLILVHRKAPPLGLWIPSPRPLPPKDRRTSPRRRMWTLPRPNCFPRWVSLPGGTGGR